MVSEPIKKAEISILAISSKLMIMRKDTQVKERGNQSFMQFLRDSSPLVQIEIGNVSSRLDVSEEVENKHRCHPETNMVWTNNSKIISKTIIQMLTKLVKKLLTITFMQVRWAFKGHLYQTQDSRSVTKCITTIKLKNFQRILNN